MKRVLIVFMLLFFYWRSVFGQNAIKQISYSGTQVTIIVTGTIKGSGGQSDPFPLLLYFISNGQDGSADSAVIVNGTGTSLYHSTPDTIKFTSNTGVHNFWACGLVDNASQSVYDPASAFYLDVNGAKDTITLKYTVSMVSLVTSLLESESPINPRTFSLYQNYPNPFNPSTTIEYQISKRSNVEVSIYNVNGQLVKTLESGQRQSGSYSVVWDGKNESGETVSSGAYFYQVKSEGVQLVKKMLFLK